MPVDKSQIKRGTFITGGSHPGVFKLPPDLEHFAETVKAAGPLPTAAGLAEIERQQAAIKVKLEELRAFARGRRK